MNRKPSIRGRVRYDWWRAHHGLPSHPKWRAVAREAGVPVSVVFHIACCLLDLASRSEPRGSIAEFRPFDAAGVVDVPVADVDRVLVVLRDIHWVEGHMIAQWDERQPIREDATAADRKSRQRHAGSRNVTLPKRDTDNGHASEAGPAVTSADVTELAAPDKDKKITTSESVAARAHEPAPSAEPADPLQDIRGKPVHTLTPAEVVALRASKRAAGS